MVEMGRIWISYMWNKKNDKIKIIWQTGHLRQKKQENEVILELSILELKRLEELQTFGSMYNSESRFQIPM